jgi:hypothetical protein
VNNEFWGMWNEVMMIYLEVILLYLPEVAKENHRKPQSEYSVSQLKFEPGTSQMQIKSVPA